MTSTEALTVSPPIDGAAPRICICVIMNHPFPDQLPLLRRIYAGRFTTVRFLIPFEQMPDEDVITVYRGSYCHAGYINDARRELAALDCDFYVVLHDDVLLNPKITEDNFTTVFPLGADEGFISAVGGLSYDVGVWTWYFGMLPKLLHPKSQLFGSGIERHTLARYLPSPEMLEQKIRAAGITPATRARIDPGYMPDVDASPTRVLFEGLSGHLRFDDAEQDAMDERTRAMTHDLFRAMLDFEEMYRPDAVDREASSIRLPLPLVTSAYATDFYILPKSGLATFAHYIGVASAANLFVEVMAPTMLFAACERVRVADDFGLDRSGLTGSHGLDWFSDVRAFAIHPFKLSRFAKEHGDAFIDQLDAIRDGSARAAEQIAAKYFGSTAALVRPGFHPAEPWGMWASRREVTASILMTQPGAVTLVVSAPISTVVPRMTLTIEPAGGVPQTVEFVYPDHWRELRLDRVEPDPDGIARIGLATDATVCPARVDPTSTDRRELGIGIIRITPG